MLYCVYLLLVYMRCLWSRCMWEQRTFHGNSWQWLSFWDNTMQSPFSTHFLWKDPLYGNLFIASSSSCVLFLLRHPLFFPSFYATFPPSTPRSTRSLFLDTPRAVQTYILNHLTHTHLLTHKDLYPFCFRGCSDPESGCLPVHFVCLMNRNAETNIMKTVVKHQSINSGCVFLACQRCKDKCRETSSIRIKINPRLDWQQLAYCCV